MASYSPEWAEDICEVPASTIRRIANEFLEHAKVGATIEIEGMRLPHRPVSVSLGKTVNNGWGGYECCWARTMLAALVGGLEVPGGTLGTTVRLNRPLSERLKSVQPGPDGFMAYPMNPTDKAQWSAKPNIRNAYRTMVPLAADGPWSQALGPTHFSWMFQDETPEGLPRVTAPDVWFVYRTNPSISFWDTAALGRTMARLPFVVAFAYTLDETNHFADVLLPDATDLESVQLIRIGGSKYVEQFWDRQGFALRQPAVEPRGDARDFTDIATELARRMGMLTQYNEAINKGAAGVPLSGPHGDFSLDPSSAHSRSEIWDAVCRAASAELTDGAEIHGLDWWKEHGLATKPFPRTDWYLYPTLTARGLRFELPYQERLKRVGAELGRRLHEHDMHWWDKQLDEYQALPPWKDFAAPWVAAVAKAGGKPGDYPFWLLTARSMQYAWGGNVGMQLIKEVADNVAGHRGVIMNTRAAEKLGIADGDAIEIATPARSVRGRAVLRQGIRPDTLLLHRPVRPLGDAVRQGLRRAEPQFARDDVARPHRRDRLRRRHRARADREGHGGAGMTRWAMIADLRRCVGCQTCTAACRHANATPPGVQWRRVLDMEFGEYPDVQRAFVPVGCQHCDEPPCMDVCPSKATKKRADGIVTIDYDLCIGCSYCMVACPYQARYKTSTAVFAYGTSDVQRGEAPRRLAARGRHQVHVLRRSNRRRASATASGRASIPTPRRRASIRASPTALTFGDLDDPQSNVSQPARRKRALPDARGARHRARLLLPVGQGAGGGRRRT